MAFNTSVLQDKLDAEHCYGQKATKLHVLQNVAAL